MERLFQEMKFDRRGIQVDRRLDSCIIGLLWIKSLVSEFSEVVAFDAHDLLELG